MLEDSSFQLHSMISYDVHAAPLTKNNIKIFAILLIITGVGGRVSLDGVAARGLVEATEKGPHNLRI